MTKTTPIIQLSPDGKRLLNITKGTYPTLAIPEGVEVIEPITSNYLQTEVLKIPSTVREMNTYWTGRVYHRFELERDSVNLHQNAALIWCDILHPEQIQIDPEAFNADTEGLALIVPPRPCLAIASIRYSQASTS